jgi:hypothetical protein
MVGYVVYIEKDEPGTVRTHHFNGIVSMADGVLTLDTDDKGRREHKMDDYVAFGIFPFGPDNQPWVN